MARQSSSTVFIGNIPYDVTEPQIQEIFAQAGQIKSFRLVTDKDSGKLKGYGFCEYYEQAAAEIAVQNINSREVSGRQLRVDFADDNMKGDERDGRRGPPAHFREPRGGPGSKAVGTAAASSAAATMASMLGGPSGPGPTQEHVNAVLGGMSANQLYDLMQQMRAMIQSNAAQARHILISNPQLTKALFQAQILLGMVKPPPAPPQAAPMPGPGPAGGPAPGFQPPPAAGPPPYQPAPGPGPGPVAQGPPVIVATGPPIQPFGGPPPGQFGGPPPQQMQQAPGVFVQPAPQPQMVLDSYGRPLQGAPPMMNQPPHPQPQMVTGQAPPQPNVAAILASVPPEQQALVQQVLSMTDEQIAQLPEGARMQVLQVKQLLVAQGIMPR